MGYELSKVDEQKIPAETVIANLGNTFLDELLDMPTMYIINSMVYEGMGSDSSGFDVMLVPLKQAIPGFIPSSLRHFATAADPYKRERKTFGESLMYNTPGRQSLLPQLGSFGQPIKQDTGVLAFFNPGQSSTYTPFEFTDELKRLADKYNDKEIYPSGSNAFKSFNMASKTFTPTKQEQNAMLQEYGGYLSDAYSDILKLSVSDEDKIKKLKKAQEDMRALVKKNYVITKIPSVSRPTAG
jgi:hypothetical protein